MWRSSRRYSKCTWKTAVGASLKPKRLKLVADANGSFTCPVNSCDHDTFKSKRGCRKHVCRIHGWYYYFDEKPNAKAVLLMEQVNTAKKPLKIRSDTSKIPSFDKTCPLRQKFKVWLCSPVGGSKGLVQAEQIVSRVMKFLFFCCDDQDFSWHIPNSVTDYCIGSVPMISDFIDYLTTTWEVGRPGVIGYLNAISHLMDYRKIEGLVKNKPEALIPSEVFLHRIKKTLGKKMRADWNTLLTVEYLTDIGCWATMQEMQQVIPYHGERFAQILLIASPKDNRVPSHELSFATAFTVAVLFLMVKAARPMSYQFLTVQMVNGIVKDGIIDQCHFKTHEKYGFDSLIFDKPVVDILNGYVKCIRPRLNPICDYLLITRTGKQLTRLCDVFGRLVFQAIGKYINPTRYRQIIETESVNKLTSEEQATISLDQKHTSNVAKIHYQKVKSREIAQKSKDLIEKLRDGTNSIETLKTIGNSITQEQTKSVVDFHHQILIETTLETESGSSPSLQSNVNEENPVKTRGRQRAGKIPFSKMEDTFIQSGLAKYGQKWTSILNDPEYTCPFLPILS